MAPSTTKIKGKGKSKDQSTGWSEWKKDKDGYYFCSRYNSDGVREKYYQSASSNGPLPDETVPRSEAQQSEEQQSTYLDTTTSSPPMVSEASGYGSGAPDYYTTALPATTASSYYGNSNQESNRPSSYYGSRNDHYEGTYAPTSTDYSRPVASYTSSSGLAGRSYFPNSTDAGASSSSTGYGVYGGSSVDSITRGVNNMAIPEHGPTKSETLNNKYRAVPEKDQKKFWKQGRVFMTLWTEPAASTQNPGGNGSHISTTWLNGTAYTEIRRFVVVREGWGYSLCCPIHTYSGQATLKAGLSAPQEHAIIYTSSEPPPEHFITASSGQVLTERLTKFSIKVSREANGPEGTLDPKSRLNYSKVYTIEHYAKVLNIGMVHKDWLPTLEANTIVKPQEPSSIQRPRDDTRKDKKDTGRKDTSSRHKRSHHDKIPK